MDDNKKTELDKLAVELWQLRVRFDAVTGELRVKDLQHVRRYFDRIKVQTDIIKGTIEDLVS